MATASADRIEQLLHSLRTALEDVKLKNDHRVVFANNQDILIEIPGYYLLFPVRELNHALSYLNPQFDMGMRLAIAKHAPVGGVFLDIGASVGVMASIGARKVGSAGLVVTVEPINELADTIRRNIHLNSVFTRHEHFVNAISSRRGTRNLNIFALDSRISTLFPYAAHSKTDRVEPRSVESILIWDVLPSDGRKLLIKIDAEGTEMEILEELFAHHRDLAARSTKVIFEYALEHVERSGHSANNLLEQLRVLGLSAHFIDPLSGELTKSLDSQTISESGNLLLQFGKQVEIA